MNPALPNMSWSSSVVCEMRSTTTVLSAVSSKSCSKQYAVGSYISHLAFFLYAFH